MPTSTHLVALVLGCIALCLGVSTVAAEEGRKGHGSVTVSYQYIHTDGFEGNAGFFDSGETDNGVLLFFKAPAEYSFPDRTLVWVTSR